MRTDLPSSVTSLDLQVSLLWRTGIAFPKWISDFHVCSQCFFQPKDTWNLVLPLELMVRSYSRLPARAGYVRQLMSGIKDANLYVHDIFSLRLGICVMGIVGNIHCGTDVRAGQRVERIHKSHVLVVNMSIRYKTKEMSQRIVRTPSDCTDSGLRKAWSATGAPCQGTKRFPKHPTATRYVSRSSCLPLKSVQT